MEFWHELGMFVTGLLLGGLVTSSLIISLSKKRDRPSGVLKMKMVDEPYLFLELHTSVSDIMEKEEVIFIVDHAQ